MVRGTITISKALPTKYPPPNSEHNMSSIERMEFITVGIHSINPANISRIVLGEDAISVHHGKHATQFEFEKARDFLQKLASSSLNKQFVKADRNIVNLAKITGIINQESNIRIFLEFEDFSVSKDRFEDFSGQEY